MVDGEDVEEEDTEVTVVVVRVELIKFLYKC